MSCVWIAGAYGFIGRHLAKHLCASGHTVHGIGHGHWTESDRKEWGVSGWLNGDIEYANLQFMLDTFGAPDVVFHLAGGSSVGLSLQQPLEDYRRTVDSTAQLLDWMRGRIPSVRVVFVSSAAVYGSGHSSPILESTPLKPFSPYGHHKAMAEQLCRCFVESYGMKASVVRFFSVYGPGLQKQLIWDVCTRLTRDPHIELGGSGRELRDWLYVDDAVALLENIWQRTEDDYTVCNGGIGRGISVHEVMQHICRLWGGDATFEFSGLSRPGDPQNLVADTGVMTSQGFHPSSSFEVGLEATVSWFKQCHKLP